MQELCRTAHSTATPCIARVSVVPDNFVTEYTEIQSLCGLVPAIRRHFKRIPIA